MRQFRLPQEREGNEMTCRICHKEAGQGDYCELHAKAHRDLKAGSATYRRVLDLSGKDCLREVLGKPPLPGKKCERLPRFCYRRKSETVQAGQGSIL
jgi:hypothetical protein